MQPRHATGWAAGTNNGHARDHWCIWCFPLEIKCGVRVCGGGKGHGMACGGRRVAAPVVCAVVGRVAVVAAAAAVCAHELCAAGLQHTVV